MRCACENDGTRICTAIELKWQDRAQCHPERAQRVEGSAPGGCFEPRPNDANADDADGSDTTGSIRPGRKFSPPQPKAFWGCGWRGAARRSMQLDPERSRSPGSVQSVVSAFGSFHDATRSFKGMPSERFELPTPWFEARCSCSAELRRRVRAVVDRIRLRRGVVEHRARAGSLREPTDERDQRELHPHPSGRQPVAPLLSYGPSVVRRRRDVTAGAPSSGSRVRLCSLHHVTPADGVPRCCVYCVFFPDHRLSNSGLRDFVEPGGADPSTRFARSG